MTQHSLNSNNRVGTYQTWWWFLANSHLPRWLPGEAVLCKYLMWRVYWWNGDSHSALLSGILGGPDDLESPRAYLFDFQPFLTALPLITRDINDQEKSDCVCHLWMWPEQKRRVGVGAAWRASVKLQVSNLFDFIFYFIWDAEQTGYLQVITLCD